jgi:hypothetical protein
MPANSSDHSVPPDAGEDLNENRLKLAAILLRTAVSLICLGWGFWLTARLGSQTGAWLLMEMQWDHAVIGPLERRTGVALIVTSVLLWIPHGWAFSLPVALMLIFDAWAGMTVGGYAFSNWTLGAHAGRYMTAIALFSWGIGSLTSHRISIKHTEWTLRIGIATVFIVHGLEAWWQHPGFTDFLIGTAENLFGWDWTEETTFWILRVIAIVDIVVALLLLFSTHRALIGWLVFWGLITALARVTTHGYELFYEVMLRSGHYLGPIVIYLLYRAAKTGKQAPTPPAS